MTSPTTFDVRPGAEIALWIDASRRTCKMLEISGEHALVEVPTDVKAELGGTIAILLGERMSIPMQIEERIGDEVLLSYKNKPHASVETLAIGKMLDASIAPSGSSDDQTEPEAGKVDYHDWLRRAKGVGGRKRTAKTITLAD